MQSKLFIPKKLKIGFQQRSDTFTGKLAYVIYYDEKGKLRKETSWQSWRDKSIDVVEIDNTPENGFTMNKGFTRFSDWGSGRAVIRIWDPRDFEFEIGLDNLVGILMHSDVSKRSIEEKCVFAWNGTELVLLPCNTDEYKSSVEYTDKQAKSVSAKTLVPGYTYVPKKEDKTVIYLGFFESFKGNRHYDTEQTVQTKRGKNHWFVYVDGKEAFTKDPKAYLASVDNEEVHQDFASKLEALQGTSLVQKIVGYEEVPFDLNNSSSLVTNYGGFYVKVAADLFVHISFREDRYHSKINFSADNLVKIYQDGKVEKDFYDRNSYSYYHTKRRRSSLFGDTLDTIDSHAGKSFVFDTPSNAKSNEYYFSSRSEEEKKSLCDFIEEKMRTIYPNAVILRWVLENGKTTKGLSYEY